MTEIVTLFSDLFRQLRKRNDFSSRAERHVSRLSENHFNCSYFPLQSTSYIISIIFYHEIESETCTGSVNISPKGVLYASSSARLVLPCSRRSRRSGGTNERETHSNRLFSVWKFIPSRDGTKSRGAIVGLLRKINRKVVRRRFGNDLSLPSTGFED
jgi:hypothetical protein